LSVAYGGIQAVRDLSLEVVPGEMVCLIGANGAGKTTTLKAISGLIAPHSGSVHFDGQPLTRLPAHQVARRGSPWVPEGVACSRACRWPRTPLMALSIRAIVRRSPAISIRCTRCCPV
jgi:ABC-type branched-subunit amino acid transport system ATPase component